MDLYFITEARFFKKGDAYYTEGSFTSSLWKRYLTVYDEIFVVARVKELEDTVKVDPNLRSDMKHVNFLPIPYYIGAFGFVLNKRKIASVMKREFTKGSSYILRVPGLVGVVASDVLKKKGLKYGVEVVGDPYEVFTPNGNILMHLIRNYNVKLLKAIVKNADTSIYVTEKKLQSRYPSKKNSFSTHASNVILNGEIIEKLPRVIDIDTPRIVTIGMLSQMYKAPDVVIDSLRILKNKGIKCFVTWVGDGKYKNEMIQYAKEKGVSDMIEFVGLVPAGEAVRKILYTNNLFILVSRTEGLPRALIEAMASGIYCIATRVGGIPELIDDKWLIDSDNSIQLANSIEMCINNPELVKKQIEENLDKVHQYSETILIRRREDFYKELIKISNK